MVLFSCWDILYIYYTYMSFKTFLETSYDLEITILFNKAHLQSNTHPNNVSTQILHTKPCPLETHFIHMQFHILT